MMRRLVPTPITAGLIPLLLCLSVSLVPAARAQQPSPQGNPGGTSADCSAQLSCSVGQTRVYDYSAVFVSEADVETTEDSGYGSSTFMGDAQVSLTPISSRGELCTYEVSLREVEVAEIVREEVVESAAADELASLVGDTYYFTQSSDGQIVEVVLGREDLPEAATFKRGVINSLNVTLKAGEQQYEVVESDISGTHLASYQVTRHTDRTVVDRTTNSAEPLLKGQATGFEFESTQSTSMTIDHQTCVISQVNIDEVVIIDQPDANDPAVSKHFHHETLTVRAAANMTLRSSSFSKAFRSGAPGINSPDLIRLPVNASVSTSPDSFDNGAVISKLLDQLLADSDNSQLIRELSRAVRGSAKGVEHLRRFTETERPTGRLARALGALLISVGSPAAQETLIDTLLVKGQDEETLQHLVGLSTLLDSPLPRLVDSVVALSSDASTKISSSATLALGAYADKLRAIDPKLSAKLVEELATKLRLAGSDDSAVLYLRALGNAGAESTLPLMASYLSSTDLSTRLSATIAMRKIESPEVESLFLAHFPREKSKSVRSAIERVLTERAAEGRSDQAAYAKAVILDWSWSKTFGGNVASATFSASALVEDEPYLIDLQTAANGQVFGNQFDIVDVQLLTEAVDAQDRRFRFFIMLVGNEIANIDDTETCSVDAEDSVWDESIDLLNLASPPIPIIGPLTLSFNLDLSIDFYINFFRQGDWCTSTSDLQMGLTPGVVLTADGYATLSLILVRGGIGIYGTLVGVEFPVYADANMSFQNAPDVCFKIDAQLLVADMQLYAWGQYNSIFGGWKPNPRPRWTLWEFDLNPEAWNLYTLCESNPGLQCLQDVFWWDGSTIDAGYDGANCFVTTPPAGSPPFIANNAYYLEQVSSCPEDMPWNGTGCYEATVNAIPGIGVSLGQSGGQATLTFYRFGMFGPIPPCPSGWTTTQYTPGLSRTCSRQPPAGYSAGDFFLVSPNSFLYTIYLDGSASCPAGNPDSTGCWLGNAPGGTSAFLWNGNFYYAEP